MELEDMCGGINVGGTINRDVHDYLKLWRCSWVFLRSSLTPSALAMGSADAQIMSDYMWAAWLWLAALIDPKKRTAGG